MGKQKTKGISIELVKTAISLTQKNIKNWREAWQMAINPENPRRIRLYDIYDDAMIDSHLSGCAEQIKGFVMAKSFKFVNTSTGEEDAEMSEKFEALWFKKFASLALDSIFYGYSLIQFDGLMTDTSAKTFFSGVSLVPRRHVVPEFGVIIKDKSDEINKGISYLEGELYKWTVPVGDPYDLGLLLKVTPHCISKKNMSAFWDTFGEMFGMPIRIAKTLSRDDAEIRKIEEMLRSMGAAPWALFPDGTEIDFKESQKTDAYKVYDERINRINSEISKCILGQTMTTDNGASKSQGEVHLEILKNIIERHADFLRDVINNELLPRMVELGIPVENYRMDWDNSIDYTPEQQVKIEEMLLTAGYDVDPKYFEDKYNIPILGKKDPQQQNKELVHKNCNHDFFV